MNKNIHNSFLVYSKEDKKIRISGNTHVGIDAEIVSSASFVLTEEETKNLIKQLENSLKEIEL